MKIGNFTIKNTIYSDSGEVWTKLFKNGEFICDIKCDEYQETFYYDLGNNEQEIIDTAQKLIAVYPDSFDGNFKENDVGSLGILLKSAYAGKYGHTSFLLKELLRLEKYYKLFEKENNKTLVVCKPYPNCSLRTFTINNNEINRFRNKINNNHGCIFFTAQTDSDFNIL